MNIRVSNLFKKIFKDTCVLDFSIAEHEFLTLTLNVKHLFALAFSLLLRFRRISEGSHEQEIVVFRIWSCIFFALEV